MINIDSKDRKILYLLLEDSRQSLKTIGKKASISKELAAYRIKRLIKNEIISSYWIYISISKLGYIPYYLYYQFEKINPKIKNDIISHLTKNNDVCYVATLDGIYDFQIDFLIGNPFDYESQMIEIKKKYNRYLKCKFATIPMRGEEYNFPFLLDDNTNKTKPRKWSWNNEVSTIDKLDFNILQKLSVNSRLQTKEVANDLNSTVSIINYRIKKMIKEKIILQYSINIDWLKLGYRYFHIRIFLSNYNKKNSILNYIRRNPYLIRIYNDVSFSFDIYCTFLLKNMEQLRKLIEDLTLEFEDSIDRCEFYSTYKVYKNSHMIPKLIKKKDRMNIFR